MPLREVADQKCVRLPPPVWCVVIDPWGLSPIAGQEWADTLPRIFRGGLVKFLRSCDPAFSRILPSEFGKGPSANFLPVSVASAHERFKILEPGTEDASLA